MGSAPETFFGAGIQTVLKLIDEGVIGEPVAATSFMLVVDMSIGIQIRNFIMPLVEVQCSIWVLTI